MRIPRFAALATLREQFDGFLSWWLRELREVGEAVLARLVPALARSRVIDVHGSSFAAESSEDIASLPPGTRLILALDPTQALVFEVTFPSAVERDLASATALYLERELPVRAERVYVHTRVKRRNRGARTIVTEVFVVHRELVDGLRARFADAKRPIGRIGVRCGGEVSGDFAPRRPRLGDLRATPLDRRLAAVAASLGVVLVAVICAQWGYERYQVGRELNRLDIAATAARAAQSRFERESKPARQLIAIMARADAADVLAVLSARVPDSGWFYEIEVTPQAGDRMRVTASGFVPTATTFIDMLGKTPEFQGVRLTSASSAGLGSGRDRIQFAARWGRE